MMLPVEYIAIAMHVHGWLLCSLVLYLALDMPPSITINLVIKHTSMHPSIHICTHTLIFKSQHLLYADYQSTQCRA